MGCIVEMTKIAGIFAIILLCFSRTSGEIVEVDTDFKTTLGRFRHNLAKEIFKEYGGKDFTISPFAIHAGLAMLRVGTLGETAFQMDRFMGFAKLFNRTIADEQPTMHRVAGNFQPMLAKYKDSEILKIANKIYIKPSVEINTHYSKLLSEKFFSEPENIDFEDNEAAAKTINTWVESKTYSTKEHVILPKTFNADTNMVLVSATYLKGKWAEGFPKENTNEADFYIDKNDTVKVQMMEAQSSFECGVLTKLYATFIILPYEDSDLSMLILMPYPKNPFFKLEQKIKNIDLQKALTEADIEPELMRVAIPKFKATFQNDLSANIQQLGMRKMFSTAYKDFDQVLDNRVPLAVSNVIQRTVIEVSEEGGKAETDEYDPEIPIAVFKTFNANRPFYYAVINKDFLPLLEGTFTGKP